MYRMSKNREDTKETLRAWLARRLGEDEVHDALWEMLEDEHYIEDVLEEAATREELLKKARRLQAFAKEMGQPGYESGTGVDSAKEGQRYVPQLDDDDPVQQRAEAVSLFWAKVADQDEVLKGFRAKVLNGNTISREQAENLLTSPAAAMFSSDWFEDNDVPLVGHRARIVGPDEKHGLDSAQNVSHLLVEWDGGRLLLPLEDNEDSNTLEVLIDARQVSAWLGRERPPTTVRGVEQPLVTTAEARRRSVLGELAQVALHLAGRFPWEQEEAARFALTGEAVQVPPIYEDLTESDDNYPRLVRITAAPWVPAETVKSVYTERRRKLKPAQMTSTRRLAVFKFVMSLADVKIKADMRKIEGPPWRRLMEAWNEQLPPDHSWRYTDERRFYRDFYHALEQLVG